jgi:hypothetical protein
LIPAESMSSSSTIYLLGKYLKRWTNAFLLSFKVNVFTIKEASQRDQQELS